MLVVRITLLAALWVVGGCSASSPGGGDGSVRPSGEIGSLVPTGTQPSRVTDGATPGHSGAIELPASVIDPVVAEVARLAGVGIDQVTITSAESATFPDGGLGCPVTGMAYTQVLVDGYRIVAEAGGERYDYRGTSPGSFRRCTAQG